MEKNLSGLPSVRKERISEELGISLATVNNWIKTKVIPSPDAENCYNKNNFENIIRHIKDSRTRLNSRANRTLAGEKKHCYSGITDKNRKKLLSGLINDFENSDLSIDDGVLSMIFAILRSNKLIDANWQINTESKLDTLLSQWIAKNSQPDTVKSFYTRYEIPNANDDILGAFYQSVQSISRKSNRGSYYTPSDLLKGITIPPDKTVLDPCCGSGGILLNILSKSHDPSRIYARDIDEISLKICFINLVLFFNNKNITSNISKQDITLVDSGEQFDYIVTNPPWGSKFSQEQKEKLIKSYPEIATAETFSVSLYNAIKMLKENGELFFFLPHSFLNVAAHKNIRRYVFSGNFGISVKLLGNAFNGVLSENILLHLTKSPAGRSIKIQNREGEVYPVQFQNITPPDYIISASCKLNDYKIIEKIYNTKHTSLNDDAIFALGIVTGNNKKYLFTEKTLNTEAIFRGKDIEKYSFAEPEYYINFKPIVYQQTAPEKFYRREKIVYRFISDRLVCVLDKKKLLILNSANLLISDNYPMETITSLFNSDIYTFIFRKKFHSKKVLKSHLRNLPLPVLSAEKHQYISDLYYDTFSEGCKNISVFQDKIDRIICDAFSIDEEEYHYIRGEV